MICSDPWFISSHHSILPSVWPYSSWNQMAPKTFDITPVLQEMWWSLWCAGRTSYWTERANSVHLFPTSYSMIALCVVNFSGCHNKIPQIGWLKQQIPIFSVLGAGSLRSRNQKLAYGRASFLGLHTATFSLSSHGLSLCTCTSGVSSSSYKDAKPIR